MGVIQDEVIKYFNLYMTMVLYNILALGLDFDEILTTILTTLKKIC